MRFKSKRGVLLALLAVLVMSAVSVASASAALPEFVPGEGGFPITVKNSQSKLASGISDATGEKYTCEGVNTSGSITAGKTMSLTIERGRCNREGRECYTEGAELGTETFSGSATLAYIKKSEKKVGIVFTVNPTVIHCGSITEGVRGSIVIPITPINTLTSEPALVLEGNGAGVQEYRSYENEKGEVKKAYLELNWGAGYKTAALEVTGQIKLATSRAVTIKA
jgi:hypothetical protein